MKIKNFLYNRWKIVVLLLAALAIGGAAAIHKLGGTPEEFTDFSAYAVFFFFFVGTVIAMYIITVNSRDKW